MNNKIHFFVNLEKRLTLHVNIDKIPVPLELNPNSLLNLKNEGNLNLFISATDEYLDAVNVTHDDDIVRWEFPANIQYSNFSGKKLEFKKDYYLNGFQSILLEIINKTNYLNGVNRKTIIVPGGNNLRDFLLKNKDSIVSVLA